VDDLFDDSGYADETGWNHAAETAAMTIATAALFAKGTTTLRNIYNWRVKETDRLFASRLGVRTLLKPEKTNKDALFSFRMVDAMRKAIENVKSRNGTVPGLSKRWSALITRARIR
jgi:5-enolpyruvylshikimate-3-phosphate synthase